MALTPQQEQEMIQIELELREREQGESTVSPEIENQRKIVSSLESSKGDPSVIGAQKTKLDMMEKGVPNEERGFMLQDKPFETTSAEITDKVTQGLVQSGTNEGIARAVGVTLGSLVRFAPDAAEAALGMKGAKTVGKAVGPLAETTVGKAIRYTGEKEAARLMEKKAAVEIAEATQVGGTTSAAERVAGMAEKATKAVKQAAQKPIAKIRESLKELPIQQRRIMESASDTLLQAKNAIGQAEQELGIDLASLGTEMSDMMLKKPQDFLSKFGKIANNLSSKTLSESADLKSLQLVRKTAERGAREARKLGQDAAEFYRIEAHFRDAVANGNKKLGEALSRFKDASQSIKSLPQEFKAKAELFNSGLKKMENLAKEKVLTDAKVVQLNNAAEILKRRASELPRQFAKTKAQLDLAIQEAQDLAKRQVRTRWIAGGAALGGAAALLGRKAVNWVTGGN